MDAWSGKKFTNGFLKTTGLSQEFLYICFLTSNDSKFIKVKVKCQKLPSSVIGFLSCLFQPGRPEKEIG